MGTDINFKNHLGRTYGTRIGLPAFDPAAQAYFAATGITGELQKAAINNLVLNLKKYNLWSKMKAVYPFVTDNRNLLDYTEDFSKATWPKVASTVTTNSITAPNGTTTADTLFGNTTNTFHYTQLVSLTPVVGQTYTSSIYVKRKDYRYIGVSCTNTFAGFRFDFDTLTFGDLNAGTFNLGYEALPNGWYRIYGSRVATSATSDSFSAILYNDSGSASFAGSASLGTYIWGAQLELGSTATTYQPIATTQQAYIASQFKYNLVNPVDSDAAFRLVFNGGWTHSSNGATPNGTNGYADTKLQPLSVLSSNNSHLSYYSRTDQANGNYIEIGTESPDFLLWYKAFNLTRGNVDGSMDYTPTVTSTQGFLLASKYSTSQGLMQYNGSQQLKTGVSGNTRGAKNIYLGAINSTGAAYYSSKQVAFSSIGDGLTDDDATNFYYSTQVFQTTLGRQVGSPAYALPAVNDVNAKLYLSAINSSDPTVNGAVDTFISGLKTDGIYSKMKAVYPFATDNRNLLSYTEDFGNAYWSINESSVTSNTTTAPNGTTTADTLTENNANNYHTVYVNNFAFTNGIGTFSIYVKFNGRKYINLGSNNVSLFNAATIFDISLGTIVSTSSGTASITDVGNGWYRCSISGTTTNGNTPLSLTLLDNSLNALYTGNGTSGVYIWGAQYETTALSTYQPQLGSAQSYFANQFKYNMINPQDDDSAFRLVFNGGWTHSPQGSTPNGVNGYADTKLVPSSVLTQNSNHLSYYSRTAVAAGTAGEIGSVRTTPTQSYFHSHLRYTGDIYYMLLASNSIPTVSNNTSQGFFNGSRTNSTSVAHFRNGVNLSNASSTSVALNSLNVFLGALSIDGTAANFSNKQTAFASIGDGLTDTEAANLYTRVQNLETLLNRQV
jgi:hypothetical protein